MGVVVCPLKVRTKVPLVTAAGKAICCTALLEKPLPVMVKGTGTTPPARFPWKVTLTVVALAADTLTWLLAAGPPAVVGANAIVAPVKFEVLAENNVAASGW